MYAYICYFESQFIAHAVQPGFVPLDACADFRVVNVGMVNLPSVFCLCRWKSNSHQFNPELVCTKVVNILKW